LRRDTVFWNYLKDSGRAWGYPCNMHPMTEAPNQISDLSAPAEEALSLEQQLELHRNVCWGFLVNHLRNHADAEDALQETWIRAHQAWPRYREQGRFRAWILRIARREALRIHQRNRRRPDESPPWEGRPASPPDETAAGTERRRMLESAIAALPVHERDAVWLRVVRECPYREIARIQRVPVNTVATRVRRGLRRLRTRLEEERP